MSTYTLKKPITVRRNGESTQVEEVTIPDVLTVGMIRQLKGRTSLAMGFDLLALCGQLNAVDRGKLHAADAIGFSQVCQALLEPSETTIFQHEPVRPIAAVIDNVTVEPDRVVEYAAQVLEASGMSRAKINAADIREFIPAAAAIRASLEAFDGSKE